MGDREMVTNYRENQSNPEFVTRFTERPDGFHAEIERGTVSLSSGPHKTLPEAQAAGARIVREILRAQIQAAGIARRGERPAFVSCCVCGAQMDPHPDGVATGLACSVPCFYEKERRAAGLPARRPYVTPTLTRVLADGLPVAGPAWGGERLEDEQLCACDHSEGIHEVLGGPCRLPGCRCEGFTAAPAVEAVL
jgi:hypothetical protein